VFAADGLPVDCASIDALIGDRQFFRSSSAVKVESFLELAKIPFRSLKNHG
jgi:hypothetical protein